MESLNINNIRQDNEKIEDSRAINLENIKKTDHLSLCPLEEDNSTFFEILDALQLEYYSNLEKTGERKGFYCNRSSILDAYIHGEMYIIEDLSLDGYFPEYDDRRPPGLGPEDCIRPYYVPAFVTHNPEDIEHNIIWIREDFRGHGYGEYMINTLKINETYALPESVKFWEKLGFKKIEEKRNLVHMKR